MYPYGKSYGTNAIYNATDDYCYGFNGMEKEKNMDASGDITDFGARFFDANFPMFLSPDPMERLFPSQSRYLFAGDNPIKFIDKDGKAKYYSFAGKFLGDDG
jgi:RHS repeat-associated protein